METEQMTTTPSNGRALEAKQPQQLPHETASSMLMAEAEAEVKAAISVAIANPRDEEDSRGAIIAACKRPRFAKAAIWEQPRGDKTIEGLSIRFAEEAARLWRNLYQEMRVTYDGPDKRIFRCRSIDLEANNRWGQDVVVPRQIERHKPRRGEKVVRELENLRGQKVYVVQPDDREYGLSCNRECSKIIRGLVLRNLPQDLREQAEDQCRKTQRNGDTERPQEVRDKLIAAYAKLGVDAQALSDYVGKSLERLEPDDMLKLRGIYAAISSGAASWASFAGEPGTGEVDDFGNSI